MKTQSSSTPGPISSPNIPLRRKTLQNSTPRTPPNARMVSPPEAPRQRRFLRSGVAQQSNGSSTTPCNFGGRLNARTFSPTPRHRQNRRDARSRSPPRDREPAYRSRSPVNDLLFGGQFTQQSLMGSFLVESIEQDTVLNNEQPSSSYDMNERSQSMPSLVDTERKELASGNKSSGLPENKTTRTKAKDIDAGSYKKPSKDFNDEERRFWAEKSSK
ncbi:uncharacterized protein EAE97_002231 [Botrytis byssoidea]|uniref:Uncharacterized protein n=1 Tax=Botrytis byssoidea TaxID=139641 RepID=A0A9P5IV23_9HELO|nr:uncharacterized protein EAE97_002231 [Botrytis byssoidea]KAF7950679.1 hypothetical protein EAE97_002231 [Botrytis byssoidea]